MPPRAFQYDGSAARHYCFDEHAEINDCTVGAGGWNAAMVHRPAAASCARPCPSALAHTPAGPPLKARPIATSNNSCFIVAAAILLVSRPALRGGRRGKAWSPDTPLGVHAQPLSRWGETIVMQPCTVTADRCRYAAGHSKSWPPGDDMQFDM